MSVTVTNTQGAAYLWSASSFAWDSAEGGKAWDDAAATSFVASDTDVVGISPRETRLPLTSRSERFVAGDARLATAIVSRTEAMGFAETYIDLIAFIMKVVESIAMNERLPKQITPAAFKERADHVGLHDADQDRRILPLHCAGAPGLLAWSKMRDGSGERSRRRSQGQCHDLPKHERGNQASHRRD